MWKQHQQEAAARAVSGLVLLPPAVQRHPSSEQVQRVLHVAFRLSAQELRLLGRARNLDRRADLTVALRPVPQDLREHVGLVQERLMWLYRQSPTWAVPEQRGALSVQEAVAAVYAQPWLPENRYTTLMEPWRRVLGEENSGWLGTWHEAVAMLLLRAQGMSDDQARTIAQTLRQMDEPVRTLITARLEAAATVTCRMASLLLAADTLDVMVRMQTGLTDDEQQALWEAGNLAVAATLLQDVLDDGTLRQAAGPWNGTVP